MTKATINAHTLQEYRHHLAQEEKSRATIQKYTRDVSAFLRCLGDAEITKARVIAFKAELTARGYAVRSINSMLASVNSFLSFLELHHCRVKSIRLQKQVFCPEEQELTRTEYQKLCNTAQAAGQQALYLILQTLCSTGMRVSELSHITVEAVKRGEAVVTCKAKTRRILLVRSLRKKLLRYAAEQKLTTGPVFITRTGRPIDRTSIWRKMKALCTAAGVDPRKVFPHNLRHLFARVFYGIEKDIAKLADILGHSSIDTTRIYIISSGAEHRRRMERMYLVT